MAGKEGGSEGREGGMKRERGSEGGKEGGEEEEHSEGGKVVHCSDSQDVTDQQEAKPLAHYTLASFPGCFGREKRPGNFCEFKLYTDVTSRQLHTSFKQ